MPNDVSTETTRRIHAGLPEDARADLREEAIRASKEDGVEPMTAAVEAAGEAGCQGTHRMKPLFRMLPCVVVIVALLLAPGAGATAGAEEVAGIVQVSPAQDLASVVASNPAYTRFVLLDGTHAPAATVVPKEGDEFVGRLRDGSQPLTRRPLITGSERLRRVFDVSAANVGFEGVAITGSSGAESCEPGCGQAVAVHGADVTFKDARVYGNPNQGITANHAAVVRVLGSRIDHNGSYNFTKMDMDDPGDRASSAGIKVVDLSRLIVDDSRVDHNYWNALWSDNEARKITVTDSTIEENGKTGVQVEISHAGEILRNTFSHNGYLNEEVPTTRAGLLVSNSSDVNVSGNTFERNRDKGFASSTNGRFPGLYNVDVWNNSFEGNVVDAGGCDRPDDIVHCYSNTFE